MAQTINQGQLMCVTFWGPSELVQQAAINLQLASGHLGGGTLATPTLSGAGGNTVRGSANTGIRGGTAQFGGEIIGQQPQVRTRKARGPNKRTLAKRQQQNAQGMAYQQGQGD